MPNTLDVRGVVGSVANEVTVKPEAPVQDRERLRHVILIHGFNNSRRAATRKYKKFRRKLNKAIPRDEWEAGSFWEFHWPADEPGSLLSAYQRRARDADRAGEVLAETWLRTLSDQHHVVLIGHSLGCRVALSAVRAIRQRGAA